MRAKLFSAFASQDASYPDGRNLALQAGNCEIFLDIIKYLSGTIFGIVILERRLLWLYNRNEAIECQHRIQPQYYT